jgi:short-subunit dehydrogenase
MNLKGKIAVVAGASGGIGREISLALADEGVELILVARRKKVLDALKSLIEESGGKASVYLADLTKEDSVRKLVSEIKQKHNRVDLLINATGVGVYKKLKDISFEEWKVSFAANADAVFLLTQKLMPILRKAEKAYVISIGSGMGKIALSGRIAYCASKFALRGFMLSLAKEHKKSNIKPVLLTVGSVLTSFGPLTIEQKKEKQQKGKEYIDPKWLAHYIVTKIKHDTLDDEVPIYPSHYFEESKKDKR